MLSGKNYQDLQVTSCLDGVVLEDNIIRASVAAVVQSKDEFMIFSTCPMFSGQTPSKVFDKELLLMPQ
jgi:hypothetical protein